LFDSEHVARCHGADIPAQLGRHAAVKVVRRREDVFATILPASEMSIAFDILAFCSLHKLKMKWLDEGCRRSIVGELDQTWSGGGDRDCWLCRPRDQSRCNRSIAKKVG